MEKPATNRRGMTLVELLVVLAILALLTTVAITSTDVLMSQGRYDATTRTLTNIQEAVLGAQNAHQPDGTLVVTGFVADMGRLPACASTDPSLGLAELWSPPSGVLGSFGLQPTIDPAVCVPCGWRGPYLRLPVGASRLCDGWGNPFILSTSGSAPVITAVASTGTSGTSGIPPVSLLQPPLANVASGPAPGMCGTGMVTVQQWGGHHATASAPPEPWVMLYGPEWAGSGFGTLLGSVSTTPISGGSGNGAYSFSFTATATIGPRFLRAYVGGTPGAPATATSKSNIVLFQQGGVIPTMSIVIPYSGTATSTSGTGTGN
jgi:prepilin-type N-terminal cleavage/methylation domain-containing protein